MDKKTNNLIYGIQDRPPLGKAIVFALQFLLSCFSATVLVPILVNGAVGEPVLSAAMALFTAGIGTLIFIACCKGKAGIYLGSSFAFIAPMIAGFTSTGKEGVFPAIMLVGVVYAIVALIIAKAGTGWIKKVLPPHVIGPAIIIIGLGLAPTAVSSIGLDGTSPIVAKQMIVVVVTFLTIVALSTFAKGFLKVIPILIGLVVGYVLSAVLGLIDFTSVKEASWIAAPNFTLPFVHYTPNFKAALIITPLALITLCEHLGDIGVYSTITGQDTYTDPGLHRTILGDGLATFVAALFGGVANTSYGEYTSTVAISRVASVFVLILTSVIAIALSFIGKFAAIINTIPGYVLGAATLILYGLIAGNGLKTLIDNRVNLYKNKNILIVSVMLVLGLGGAGVSFLVGSNSISVSGMSLATIIGVILNLVLPDKEGETE